MKALKDPLKNRVLKQMPLPYQTPISQQQLFSSENCVNWNLLKEFLTRQGVLPKNILLSLIDKAYEIFKNEPNLLKLNDPLTVVGDIHGQYYDLLKLLENKIGGNPATTSYLFLGDYVDRGNFSIEVVALLLSLKITYPKNISMLREHNVPLFLDEGIRKYDQTIYESFMNLFDQLPLAAVVNGKFLCVHGGISPDIQTLQSIEKIDRHRQIPIGGLLCDLMWADPVDHQEGKMSTLVQANQVRGCSYFFGRQLCDKILKKNKLMSLIRAHEAQNNGFKMYHWSTRKQFPTIITIFSAPNYCDFYNNKGAVIRLLNNTVDIQQFLQSPHPYFLPDFMDLFEWSIPFMAEKITELFYSLIKLNKNFGPEDEIPLELIEKEEMMGEFLLMHKKSSEENASLVHSNGRSLDKQLIEDEEAREYTKRKHKKDFEKKKSIDEKNQKRPE